MRPCKNPFDTDNFTLEMLIGASPAAGATYVVAAPVNARSQLSVLSFQLVSDANVASRYSQIELHRGADVYVLGHSFSPQVANATRQYLSFPTASLPSVAAGDTFIFAIPDVPLFLEGDALHVIIRNIQATDQLSAIRLSWKIWPYEQ